MDKIFELNGGEKMSKSLDNYGVTDEPADMFGKLTLIKFLKSS